MGDTRFGLNVENFDLYFEKLVPFVSQPAKEALPKDVLYRLRKGKLSFFGKLWVLWKCLGKRWWLVVEEENGGLTIDDFIQLRESIKRRDYGVPKAEGYISGGTFVTASKDLADSFDYLNRLSTSPAYNYLQRVKNSPSNSVSQREDELIYIARFLCHYESSKKKWVNQSILTIPEWYVLLALYHGKEVVSSTLHKETFRYAFQSSINKIKRTFRTLKDRNLIEKIGSTRKVTLKITPLGKDLVRSILDKYAVNC